MLLLLLIKGLAKVLTNEGLGSKVFADDFAAEEDP